MKTVKQWFESVANKELREALLHNLEKHPYDKHSKSRLAGSFKSALIKGFRWSKATGGIYEWRDVYKESETIIFI